MTKEEFDMSDDEDNIRLLILSEMNEIWKGACDKLPDKKDAVLSYSGITSGMAVMARLIVKYSELTGREADWLNIFAQVSRDKFHELRNLVEYSSLIKSASV